MPPLAAENRLKTPQNHTEEWQWHASTWWVVRGRKISFSSAAIHTAFATTTRDSQHDTSTMNASI